MATIVERDSSASAVLVFILFAILVVGGIWFASTQGMFGKGGPVIENNKTVVLPTPAPAAK